MHVLICIQNKSGVVAMLQGGAVVCLLVLQNITAVKQSVNDFISLIQRQYCYKQNEASWYHCFAA